MQKLKHLISIEQLDRSMIEQLIKQAKSCKAKPQNNRLAGKILGLCFFESSTRTRLSFESAILKLGGSTIGFAEAAHTSATKGESLSDTVRVLSSLVDGLVIRHPKEGAAKLASEVANIPVINAGDGSREHPTQTLLDLFAIEQTQKKLDGLKIAFVGDLKYGRTVHSLALACRLFDIRIYFVSPESLTIPQHVLRKLKTSGVKYSFHASIEEVIGKVDVLYMTRTQKERFADPKEYDKVKKAYVLQENQLTKVKKNLKILHPLPRVCELPIEIDRSPHAYYFEQAQCGLYMRQALLLNMLTGDR